MLKTWEDPQCGHCGEHVDSLDILMNEDELVALSGEMPLYTCPQCGRDGCPQCMPAGNNCLCPECEENKE